jgi:excisionase family DNA binding protein
VGKKQSDLAFVTVAEAAKLARCSVGTVYSAIRSGVLPAACVPMLAGNSLLIRREYLREWQKTGRRRRGRPRRGEQRPAAGVAANVNRQGSRGADVPALRGRRRAGAGPATAATPAKK